MPGRTNEDPALKTSVGELVVGQVDDQAIELEPGVRLLGRQLRVAPSKRVDSHPPHRFTHNSPEHFRRITARAVREVPKSGSALTHRHRFERATTVAREILEHHGDLHSREAQ